jgi:hypothetical protein
MKTARSIRHPRSIRITAIICMVMFVLGMVFPHFVSARDHVDAHAKVVHAAHEGGNGGPAHGNGLPFDDKDADPERDLPAADEREMETEVIWLRIFVARFHEVCLSRILTEHSRHFLDNRLASLPGLPSYIVLRTLLI